MTPPRFEFVAPVLRMGGAMVQHYLPLPDDIADALLESGRRIIAELNGHRVKRAIHRKKDTGRFIVMSRGLLRDVKVAPGDMVVVAIWSDPEPDRVDVPEEFLAALAQDPEANQRFMAMTPGLQRSVVHYVSTAKRVETRIRRSLEMAEKLRTRSLYGDRATDD